MTTQNKRLADWVESVREHCQPKAVVWCDGSDEEYDKIVSLLKSTGDAIELNAETHPGCWLHRSDPNDVARTEHLTFICSSEREDVGPNNNWMDPKEGHEKVDALFAGAMQGRTMYVIPYCMGPIDSPFSRCGVELTDSPYVVANMKIMTRMGSAALKRIEKEDAFVKGLHSTGDLKIENRLIMHFPEELTIKSIGSGYGGNALLGKKCHALRIASWQAKTEGWLAEHMLILGIENPQGEKKYVAAAFPSACGKTNLAMLIPPAAYTEAGWKVWTVGDDIAWLHPGDDGKLYAINPEAGYFGVAPGTGPKTNPNAHSMLNKDAVFTNVAVTADNQPWWEGIGDGVPVTDWKGNPYSGEGAAAHPNSRFTVSAKQCPSWAPESEDAKGVPISAIIFGGRRPSLVPLVYESASWEHGVLIGASVGSETTAASTGKVGVMRRDPMAMKPFCGYNFADYWNHWLSIGDKLEKAPKVFHVNWFRQDDDGKFMWPGFGENIRVLNWILDRCEGNAEAVNTPIGAVPAKGAIDTEGLDLSASAMEALLDVDITGWKGELKSIGEYFESYGERLPEALRSEQQRVAENLDS